MAAAPKGGRETDGIIRVFPHKTSYTPDDGFAFIGMPPLKEFIPDHKAVHVSCSFTWDKTLCKELAYQWEGQTDKPVSIGGPAFNSPVDDFYIQGMYLHKSVTFTTRGCDNNCPWCCVPRIEGKLRELPIQAGNIIQDNNFLQADRAHKDKAFDMLRTQRKISFRGGLETDLIDDHFVNAITSLRIFDLWLACDTDAQLPRFKTACEKLKKAGFKRDKIRCYALIGDNMEKNDARLREIYEIGAMPFAQLYRDFSEVKTQYSKKWNAFERMWQRPAATRSHMEKGT